MKVIPENNKLQNTLENLTVINFTLNASPFLSFFCLNFSRAGGATRTTYGFRSEFLKILRDCGCKFKTQILPAATTERIASREVP